MHFLLIILLAALPAAARSEDRERQLIPEVEPISIEAHVIEAAPPTVRAEGDVLFQQGQKRLVADEVTYNYEEHTGILTDATFTTCDLDRMDYRITAREIRLTGEQRLKARRVRVYLGNLRILSLPALSFRLGPAAPRETLIPRPGYNSFDGLFMTLSQSLVDTDGTTADLRLRLTTRRGIQGGVIGGHVLQGDMRAIQPYVPDSGTELRQESILEPAVEEGTVVFEGERRQPQAVAAFGAVLLRERAYDIDESSLLTWRAPEVGVRYVSPEAQVRAGEGRTGLGLQTRARVSWGRFREIPDGGYAGRWDARGTLSTTVATLGPSTALRASALGRYSAYDGGDSYRVLAAALDVSRVFAAGSYASVRLISHHISGSTPFEFDDVDVRREVQAAARYVVGRNTFAALVDYDLDRGSVRDWQISLARRLHCLEPSITWRNRFRQISIGIRVLGL